MSSKVLLLCLLGLIALSAVDARNLLKKSLNTDISSDSSGSNEKHFSAKSLLRKKRDASSSSSEESAELSVEAQELAKFFIAVGWSEDKLDILKGFLEEVSDSETNVTLVGWQHVLNDDGTIQEVNAIQFVLPPKPTTAESQNGEGNNEDDDDDDEDDIDEDFGRMIPHNFVNKLREIFEPFEAMGIPVSASFEEYNQEGDPEVLIYLDKDTLYSNSEGFTIFNKSLIVTQAEVDAFAKTIQDKYSETASVLKYDANWKLLDGSVVSAYLLGSVIDGYEYTDEVFVNSPAIMAQVWASYPREEISKQLAASFNKKWPEWEWRVLIDAENFYLSRDISITLSIDNLDFDETSDISYFVYGRKPEGLTH